MIKHLKSSDIDVQAWDRCIRESFNGLIYAYSWYLDIVHDGWEALVENDYERVMPLTGGKKYGISYLYQPYFVQQLGVFSKSLLTPQKTFEFIEHIPTVYKYYDIKLNSFNKIEKKYPSVQPNKNHLLDLINPYDKLSSRFSGQTKRNLKNSTKHKLTLMKNIKPEAIIKLFRENRGKNLSKWKTEHYTVLEKLMYSSIYKGSGTAYGVFTEFNELCAGAFFMRSKSRLIFLFSGSNELARQNSSMTFLIDAVIRENASQQIVFDFEGSNDPNLARFYKGFGAKEIFYPGLVYNNLPFPTKQLFNIYQRLKNKQ